MASEKQRKYGLPASKGRPPVGSERIEVRISASDKARLRVFLAEERRKHKKAPPELRSESAWLRFLVLRELG